MKNLFVRNFVCVSLNYLEDLLKLLKYGSKTRDLHNFTLCIYYMYLKKEILMLNMALPLMKYIFLFIDVLKVIFSLHILFKDFENTSVHRLSFA